MRVEAEIRVGEAARAAKVMTARWGLTNWAVPAGVIIGLLGLAAGYVLSLAAQALIGFNDDVADVMTFVVAIPLLLFVGLPTWQFLARAHYRRRLAGQGISGPIPASYEITPTAFIGEVGGLVKIASWSIVTEVLRSKGWWIVMAQGEGLYVPSRAFSDVDTERSFISELVSRLTPEARGRSGEAVRFIG